MFFLAFFQRFGFAEMIDIDIIGKIESSNRPGVCSFLGCQYGRGLYQVSEILLKEFNEFNDKDYLEEDLFNESINKQIAEWYLIKRIPQMLRYYGKEVNLKNILISYNEGIKAVVDGKYEDREHGYVEKYLRLVK
jgi:hypothetical protein